MKETMPEHRKTAFWVDYYRGTWRKLCQTMEKHSFGWITIGEYEENLAKTLKNNHFGWITIGKQEENCAKIGKHRLG